MRPPNWFRMFPDQDFRHHLGLQPGDAPDFFARSEEAEAVCAERKAQLRERPGDYAVLPETASGVIAEALAALSNWTGRAYANGLEAGGELEPDWVLLTPDGTGLLRVAAGVVCFPSTWSLPEKFGLPVSRVHEPVPGLNESLSRQIDTFLGRLASGAEWERENWGLAADGLLDHHPNQSRAPLTEASDLATTWLRLERQLFVRLDGGGLLFGIRVTCHRLDELCAEHPGLSSRIALALESMPEAVSLYKGISDARSALVRSLRGSA